MTRKRFVKLLMSKGVKRNNANRIAQEFRKGSLPYDVDFADLDMLCNFIVIEAMCLYLSGDLDRLEGGTA